MANILHVCNYFDPSGDVARSVKELNKHSAHKHATLTRWIHPKRTLYKFDEDSDGQSREASHVKWRFEWADAIIYHFVGWNSELGYRIPTLKPCAFRNANVEFDKEVRKFYCQQAYFANPTDPMYSMLASCHMGAKDFMGDKVQFLPALMPIWDELYTPALDRKEIPCTSVGYIKHAAEITERLSHCGVRRLGMEGQAHDLVMHQRRLFVTVTIDNLSEGHYGLAGTESLAQGIPAIAWNHPHTLAQLEDIAPGVGNPFIQADSVRTAVKRAVEASTSAEEGLKCRAWIEKYYDSRYLVPRYWDTFCDRLVKS